MSELQLTDKEKELIDKRRITSARNAEKARLRRLEKKEQIKELERVEYEQQRNEFNTKLKNVVKPPTKPVSVKPVKAEPIVEPVSEEDSDSEEEKEEFVVYSINNKRKIIDQVNEEFKKELENVKNELQSLKKPKEPEPIKAEPPVQTTKKIVPVKLPSSDLPQHIRHKILNF
jgi:hypothetical protein